jgi:HSF-type DNA-binding
MPNQRQGATFPEQLHHVLGEMAKEGMDNIASWQPHGRCFKIHNPQAFIQTVLGRYVYCWGSHIIVEPPPILQAE